MVMVMGRGVVAPMSQASPLASSRPSIPPRMHSSADSIRNWTRISLRRAPMALRRPISKVRSFTLTSMMFMTTMPPTTSEMRVMGVTTMAMEPVNWSTSWFTSSTLTRPKSSSSRWSGSRRISSLSSA